ncbi:transcription factor bHLH112-like isoform X2 [Euphorbia lathyris]|uniref:transcription factor bHLH112-like isoform X2 n=1 Tax=Euphorbia lathyris TaxID=212925 RepID=UPI0033135B1D
MAEDFQTSGSICGGNWWNLPNNKNDHLGNYGSWLLTDLPDFKPRSCKLQQDHSINGSLVFQDSQRPQQTDSGGGGGGGGGGSGVFMESTLQMMGFGVSSSSTSGSGSSPSSDWSQTLLRGNSMLQEDMNSTEIQKEWSPKSFTSSTPQDFSLTSSANSTLSYPNYQSTPLLQTLFQPSDHHHHHQQSFYDDRTAMNYSSSPQNYGTILSELSSPSWPKLASFLKPSSPHQQSQTSSGGLHFSNNTPFWNASSADQFLSSPSSQPQFLMPAFEDKPNSPSLTLKSNDSGFVGKKGSEPAFKRARIETPSPLPTFKVRKEKLGDRITALQQLVSPFGKTDTASVLHEAIEYIKFLHDQVNVLSTPYMKNGNQIQHQQVGGARAKEAEDLKSRGLCLVPISSTFPVANETTADFWTPTFGV